jgi:conjugal transfer pilus assembly protein TraW
MIKIRTLIGIIVISFNYICYAEDLGVVGKTYPILEPDMIEWIKAKADTMIKNGQWQQIQNQAVTNAKNQINNPNPVKGITDAKVTKTWYYKPLIELKHNLTDIKGHIIAKAGLYNALRYKPFDTQLLFINGNNKKQVNWAVDHFKNDGVKTKIVLTQGSFINLDKQFKLWFYYDQNGRYTQKLNIQHVPAIVIQDGEELKISEINNKLI